ncbi:MAG: DNA polymerase III subunit delta [Candidatus Binataceae bacterium]
MAAETALAFLRALAQERPPAALTAFAGPHAFIREYAFERLRARLAAEGFARRAFQLGGGDDLGAITGELESGDLFSPKRLVVCRMTRAWRERGGAEDPGEDRSRGADSGSETVLIAAIERLPAAVRVALVCERDSVPAKLRRLFEQRGVVVNCARPFDNQLAQYAELFARNAGFRLAPSAIELLGERYGSDLGAVANAINRATIAAREGQTLEAADFETAGASRVPDLFELADAIARGNANECLGLLSRAIQSGRDPIELLAVEIIPLIRRMLIAAAMMARRKSPAAVASVIGLPPPSSMLTRAVAGARTFGLVALRAAHRRATELDERFKAGLLKERESAIAAMLLELTLAEARPAP